jgi:hypothetical protein
MGCPGETWTSDGEGEKGRIGDRVSCFLRQRAAICYAMGG